jgi:hypothetical protein
MRQKELYWIRWDVPLADTIAREDSLKNWGPEFKSMASKHMSDKRMKEIIDAVFEFDKLDDIEKLNRLMVFKQS